MSRRRSMGGGGVRVRVVVGIRVMGRVSGRARARVSRRETWPG